MDDEINNPLRKDYEEDEPPVQEDKLPDSSIVINPVICPRCNFNKFLIIGTLEKGILTSCSNCGENQIIFLKDNQKPEEKKREVSYVWGAIMKLELNYLKKKTKSLERNLIKLEWA